MRFETLPPDKTMSLIVKNILVFEEDADTQKTVLPFFADGYPGIMFQQTKKGLWVSPHNKLMPPLFLYGQTIQPIELNLQGTYSLIVFQLYPFVLNSFFNVQAKDLNDGCYDLQAFENGNILVRQLGKPTTLKKRVELLSDFLARIFLEKRAKLDLQIRQAIHMISESKGQKTITQLCEQLQLTERTLERRFLKEVGISAKQFSGIIQFQGSMAQLSAKDYTKLSDVVYKNGYADQSHFIKVFKAFTGKTPKAFK